MLRMSRGALRTLFLLIIIGTLPFYVIGIGLWLFSPARDSVSPTLVPTPFATFTPLGQDGAAASFTPLGITPSVTEPAGFPTFPPDQFPTVQLVSPTPPPTRFMTSTPQPTQPPTDTLAPTLTPPPTQPSAGTTPIVLTPLPFEPLLPPSDTPEA